MAAAPPHRVQVQQVLDGMLKQGLLFQEGVALELQRVDTQGRCAIDDGHTDGMACGFEATTKTEQQVPVKRFLLEQTNHRVLNNALVCRRRVYRFGKFQEFCIHSITWRVAQQIKSFSTYSVTRPSLRLTMLPG